MWVKIQECQNAKLWKLRNTTIKDELFKSGSKNVKKNQNQNEKLKKAVKYTLGALAGVGVAALIGYGIINKSQGKKVVDKAKDAASEAVNKGKDKINPSSQEKGKEVLFKVLAVNLFFSLTASLSKLLYKAFELFIILHPDL